MKKTVTLLAIIYSLITYSQVGIGTTTIQNGVELQIESTSKGLLISRVALTSTAVQAPVGPSPIATGVLVYNTATAGVGNTSVVPGFYYWSGSEWTALRSTATANSLQNWSLLGNSGTTPGTNYLGTTDNKDLQFRTNAVQRTTIKNDGSIILGNSNTPLSNTLTSVLPSGTQVGLFTYTNNSPRSIRALNVSGTEFVIDGGNLEFVALSGLGSGSAANVATVFFTLQPVDNKRGDFEQGNTDLNSNNITISIPEINVKLQSSAIVAKTRKLKAVWTPEFAQDLNAYHALDAEAELTSVMSEYIALEIDLEILDMLIDSAAAGTEFWTAENNKALDGSGFTNANLGFLNSQGQWFQTLGTKMQKLSNVIHQKTLRGGANFMILSPSVATVLESIPGFASTSDGDAAKSKYAFGVQKSGQLNNRYDVYKNPYMTENVILMGYRGGQFLEAGAVFAPYIPLIMTPLVYDPDTFVPRKGLLTRYAKKMVRPEFYGKIYVSGLNTI